MGFFKSIFNPIKETLQSPFQSLEDVVKGDLKGAGDAFSDIGKSTEESAKDKDLQKVALVVATGATAGVAGASLMAGSSVMSSIQQKEAVKAQEALIAEQEKASQRVIWEQVQAQKDLTQWSENRMITTDQGKVVSISPEIFAGQPSLVNAGTNKDRLTVTQIEDTSGQTFLYLVIAGAVIFFLFMKGKLKI